LDEIFCFIHGADHAVAVGEELSAEAFCLRYERDVVGRSWEGSAHQDSSAEL
jgi:hypothetical protein